MYQAANNLIPNGFLSYLTLFICTKVLHKTYQYNIGKRKAHLQKKKHMNASESENAKKHMASFWTYK
jgi:hypothetical protein